MAREYTFSEVEAQMMHQLIKSHIQTLHNFIVSNVERGDYNKAENLIVELRQYQALYAKTNVEAHRVIDGTK